MNHPMCISCGMPMRLGTEELSGNDRRSYCHHCTSDDGSMKSYDEVLTGMAAFIVRGQGIDASIARTLAVEMMAKLPAWSEQSE